MQATLTVSYNTVTGSNPQENPIHFGQLLPFSAIVATDHGQSFVVIWHLLLNSSVHTSPKWNSPYRKCWDMARHSTRCILIPSTLVAQTNANIPQSCGLLYSKHQIWTLYRWASPMSIFASLWKDSDGYQYSRSIGLMHIQNLNVFWEVGPLNFILLTVESATHRYLRL